MFYSIRHITKFQYSGPVSESLMEVRLHPRTELNQRCLSFQLSVSPRARATSYRDYLGNTVHHFDVPGPHQQLVIVSESMVDLEPPVQLPFSLPNSAWSELDSMVANGDYWEMLMPSHFSKPTPALEELAGKLGVMRRDNPLRVLRELNTSLYHWFEYVPKSTQVDSGIDEAIEAQTGVCQDFAHIMIALVRGLRVPCRYVSGYLFHSKTNPDRSAEGASHAWAEAFLPGLGWVGFDPTNNLFVGDRHIRVAIGRDYADVPPTKGVFKGSVKSELAVAVRVAPRDTLPPIEEELNVNEDWSTYMERENEEDQKQQQQQQQQ
jgi:transglutaminase-like putative cysteine protease